MNKKTEHSLQSGCIKWFRMQYPKLRLNLFAIPNGAKRDFLTGKFYVREGLTKGVADCFLSVMSGGYGGVWIEFKSKTGKQSPEQKDFELAQLSSGYAYWIIRDFDSFRKAVQVYLEKDMIIPKFQAELV